MPGSRGLGLVLGGGALLTTLVVGVFMAGAGACGASQGRASRVQADIVFLGGDLHTMHAEAPYATALAVRGERILAVGNDTKVRALIGEKTRVVQLEGRSLTPGLSDAHCHLYGLGMSLESVNLRDIPTPEAAASLVAEASTSLEAGEWVTGRGWDQNLWPGHSFPNHATLDAVASDRPVALRRIDGHALWANTIALELAGIDEHTADPAGGKILRDEEGKATGVLIDMAMDLVESKIPKPSTATIKRRILAAANLAASVGITSVHEMGISDEVANVYRSLADEGRLPVRVYAFLAGDMKEVLALGERNVEQDRDGTQFFVMRAIKLFADGALGSRGAAMLQPYSDDANNKGLWLTPAEDLNAAALAAAEAGWQLGVHAIGDAGNRAVLDAFEAASKANPSSDLRFRVEHAQIVSSEDLPRFAALGVIASMQPTHATSDMPWAQERVGKERIGGAYAWRSLLDSGAHIAAGSDFPVERVSPLLGVYAAVTRQNAKGEPSDGWLPEQKMILAEALAAFTRESAYAAFAEQNRGLLQPGFVADLTIYDRALAPDRSLLKTAIDMTVVGGAVKFERE